MYFIIDGILLAILFLVIFFGLKKGFTGNWIFNIIRTLIALAGGVGAAVGVYFLMSHFGWLEVMSDSVKDFFGRAKAPIANYVNSPSFLIIFKVIAFLPFGVVFAVLGYVLLYWLLGLITKVFTVPLEKFRENKVWRIIDGVLGFIFNLAVFGVITLAIFGVIYTFNSSDLYTHVLGEGVLPNVNHSIEVILNGMHETLSAGVVSGFLYNNNPLNAMLAGMF